jgi:alanyl-tRNA synthetase
MMAGAYLELRASRERVARETFAEEERFGHTLRMAIPRLEEAIAEAKAKPPEAQMIPGDQLFKLYDTYGLPRDLIEELAQEHGVMLDWQGFEAKLRGQQSLSRASAAMMFRLAMENLPDVYRELATKHTTTFRGYEHLRVEATIVALAKSGQPAAAAGSGDEVEAVLDQTPFYAEAGGQVADRGALVTDTAMAEVLDVQRPLPGLIVHKLVVRRGTLKQGERVEAVVDEEWRARVVKNHTGTHLVHEALRRVLGDHVRQEGSLVAPDRLRFDFRHFGPLTAAEMVRIERMVNEQLWRNLPVLIEEGVPFEEAVVRGAKAFFAEKYADQVRVVAVPEFGLELCGGTHVHALGEIGILKIVGESGVAAGIRRIEAYTGPGAYEYLRKEEEVLHESAAALKTRPLELPEKVDRLAGITRELEREIERLRARLAASMVDDLVKRAERVEGIQVVRSRVEHFDQKGLRDLVDRIRTKLGSGVVVLGTVTDGKVGWVAGVTADMTKRVHAGHLVRELARVTGGDGGGRPDLAEAGGKDPSKLDHALGQIPSLLRRLLQA